MNIINSEIERLYNKEDGKIILEFDEERYKQYINIIENTPQYKSIIDSIPLNLSNLEKAYYVYNKLGRILYENNNLVYNHIENVYMYYGLIRPGGVGNCRQMSELYISMLTYKNIIEGYYLIRKPVGVEDIDLRHIDAILLIDGKKYMTNIIRDTVNIRAGIRNMKFGFTDSKESRIEKLKQIVMNLRIIPQALKNKLIQYLEENKFEEFINTIITYENENKLDIGSKYFKNKIPKIEYMAQVESQIGEFQQIPIKYNKSYISIEELDERINHINNFEDIGFPFNLNASKYRYLEDVIKYELIPKMVQKESSLRVGWSFANNVLSKDTINENLELDIGIIIDFLSRISPELDSELGVKYIKLIISELYKQRYKMMDIDFEDWSRKNIKVYKTILDSDLTKEELQLKTFLVIRKFKDDSHDKRYIFYEFENDKNKFIKQEYQDVTSSIGIKKAKICSKFSKYRKDFLEELEI